MKDKQTIRKAMAERRKCQDPGVALNRSRLAQSYILQSPVWRKARSVALYIAIRGEMDTSVLIRSAIATGKKVFLPVITAPGSAEMEFVPYESDSQLAPGPMGIPQPTGTPASICPDLVIAPGVAFDRQGTRLGYGGGYYDRYLQRQPGAPVLILGLCFGFQILDHLPSAPWDKPVNGICSESGLLWL